MRIGIKQEEWTRDEMVVVRFNAQEMSILTQAEIKHLVTQRVTSMIAERIYKAVEPTIDAALKGVTG